MSDLVPQLDRLKAQLLTSGLSQKNSSLFQVINQLIDALRQGFSEITAATGISGGGGSGLSNLLTFITTGPEAASLPNSRQLLAGIGITFDDTVANQRTLNVSGFITVDHVPMSTGAEPLEIMSNGAGEVLLVGFTP